MIAKDKKKSWRCKIYEDLVEIGCGTYGKVSMTEYNGRRLAIKEYTYSDTPIHLTTIREIKALRSLRSKFILNLEKIIVDKYKLYLVFSYYASDLGKLILKENLTVNDIKHIFWQTLNGVRYMHSKKMIHRDIKPGNILVNKNSPIIIEEVEEVKYDDADLVYPNNASIYSIAICDFGMTRTKAKEMTPGVVTLWYRSPELLLGTTIYSEKNDIWSLGIILFEMLTKSSILKNSTEIEQLDAISKHLGTIDSSSMPLYEAYPMSSKNNLDTGDNNLKEEYPCINSSGLDLIQKMLSLNPDDRSSAEECLIHPFLSDENVKRLKINRESSSDLR